MNKKSNLGAIKQMAIAFLYQDISETEYSPAIIMHPVFESGFMAIQINNETKFVNIVESKESLRLVQKQYEENILKQNSAFGVYILIRKSYRLTFLKYIKKYLSLEDMSELLAHAWTSSENPNQDANVSLRLICKWFREAKKDILMTESEYDYYNSLPQIITVYRGVAIGRNPDGLSWTCSRATAEWFANRFNTDVNKGYFQSMEIDKSLVLAYFNSRGEDEVVVDMIKRGEKYGKDQSGDTKRI